MLVVDLMHEVELGVWKILFIHLLRIVASVNQLHELDRRYVSKSHHNTFTSLTQGCSFRQIPSFGRDTIRKFRSNTSELKQMATRDYEDLLQVSVILSRH